MLIYFALLINTTVMMKPKECKTEVRLLTCGFLSFQWLSLVSVKQTERCILRFSILCFCTLAWLFRHFDGNSSSLVPTAHPSNFAWKKKKHNRKVKQFEYKLIFKRQVTGQKWAAHLTPLALPHLSILEVPQNTLAPEIPSLCNTCDF